VERILIRPFRLADLPRILKIESAAFSDDAYTPEMFMELNAECPDLFLIAKHSGRVVGYIVTAVEGRKAEVVSIAVDNKHRGIGIGKALMAHTLASLQASGVRRVHLTVRPSNQRAVRFYRSFGFVRTGRIARYYHDGSDALKMRLTFVPR